MIAVGCLVLLAACGGGSDSGGSDGKPQCADVFKVGATIPKTFDGCYDGDEPAAVLQYKCVDGGDQLVTDEAFGRVGGVVEKRTDEAYTADFDACKGLDS